MSDVPGDRRTMMARREPAAAGVPLPAPGPAGGRLDPWAAESRARHRPVVPRGARRRGLGRAVRGPLAAAAALVAGTFALLVLVHPGAMLRGEVLTAAGHAWSAQPWRGLEIPAFSANPILSDDMGMMAPWDAHFRRRASRFRAPLWNPDSAAGAPFVANNQSAVLAPAQWPRWLWRSPRARTLGLLLVPLIAASGMFALLAAFRVRPAAAAIGGLAWASAACLQVWSLYPLAETLAWFTWLAAGVAGVLAGRDARTAWRIVAGAGLAAMLLAGHLPTALQASAVGGLLVLGWCALDAGARVRARALLAPLAAGLLLAAPQVLTALEYYGASRQIAIRGAGGGRSAAEETLGLDAAWSWLVPEGFGLPHAGGFSGPVNFNEATAFIGLAPLILALVAVTLSKRRAVRWMAVAAAACLATAYGMLPIGATLARTPFLAWAPGLRWIVVAQWAACLLAGLGADALLRAGPRRALPHVLLVGGGLFALTALHPAARSETSDPAAAAAVALAAAGCAVALALVAGLATRARTIAAPLVAASIVAGCAWTFGGFTSSLPPDSIPGETVDTARIGAAIGDRRVLSIGWTFPASTNLLAGLPSAQGWDAVNLERTMRYAETAGWEPQPREAGRVRLNMDMIRRAAVGAIVSDRPVQAPLLLPVRGLEGRGLHAWSVQGAHPLVGWYAGAIPVRDREDALGRLARADRLPHGTILVEGARHRDARTTRIAPLALDYARPRPELVRVSTDRPAPGWVVLRESYAPGWRARLDGRSVPLHAVDGAFIGVHVPEGAHEVEIVYEPLGWHAGLAAAALGAALLALLALRGTLAPLDRRDGPRRAESAAL